MPGRQHAAPGARRFADYFVRMAFLRRFRTDFWVTSKSDAADPPGGLLLTVVPSLFITFFNQY
jgi:hypothetical protein